MVGRAAYVRYEPPYSSLSPQLIRLLWQLIESGFKSREQQDGEGESEAQA